MYTFKQVVPVVFAIWFALGATRAELDAKERAQMRTPRIVVTQGGNAARHRFSQETAKKFKNFQLVESVQGLKVSIDGATVTAQASSKAKPGTYRIAATNRMTSVRTVLLHIVVRQ